MIITEMTALVFAGSVAAGLIGSVTGLGGGVVLVPFLTIAFGVDLHYAIGASLVSVIATSSGAAVAYVREGYSNIRAGMFLELATTLGATLGAFLVTVAPTGWIAIIFGIVLLFSLVPFKMFSPDTSAEPVDRLAEKLHFDSAYPVKGILKPYHVRRIPLGFGIMGIAGLLSGLLGIGSGATKVLAMDRVMGFPFKVSTTTSNFMIGVTAAASAGIYLSRGYIDPGLAMPTMLGVLLGAVAGTRILIASGTRILRIVFNIVIFVLAIQMIHKGLIGGM
ncbi:MAG: sulfite exporter TauE/SafE family protein [Syntrophaceae bacterium]